MPVAFRWRYGLVAGLGAVALTAVQAALPPQQPSSEPVAAAVMNVAGIADASSSQPKVHDPIVTGSVGPALSQPAPQRVEVAPDEVTPAPRPVFKVPGSEEFLAALELLEKGDAVAAYALARGIDNEVERRAIQWTAIHNGGGAIDYDSVIRFSADAPDFATGSVFKTRLEQALTRAGAAGAEIIETLGGSTPTTVAGQIALATAYLKDGQTERARRLARQIWTENFLDQGIEKRVLRELGDLLDRDAHWARAVHLMMHDRARGVERLMQHFSPEQKSLAVARIAVSRNAKNAKKLLDAVHSSLQDHPVYLFSRAQRARQFELWDDAVSWLNKAEGRLPDAAEWWYERRTLTRQLMAMGKYDLAYQAAAGFREGPDGRLVDAQFHAGFIALSFLDDAEGARGHFEAMRKVSTLPDSIAQANYWLGRAKRALGDKLGANEAFAVAARHSTVFYGQLARAELDMSGVHLRGMPAWQPRESKFEQNQVVQAIRLLADNGAKTTALSLLRSFARELQEGADLLLAARLAQQLGAHHLAIEIAGIAEQRGAPLDLFSFPKDGLPSTRLAEVDLAAVYAVTKQESHFRSDAVSHAGARGLMQLMPGTAEETAAKVGVEYSRNRLTSDPAYNALLGSTYLAAQLARYDGSLVLAAAAYNAGGGNANKWIKAYGDPRSDDVDAVVWIEQIPFQETRKYVQRVFGNYLVYRARLGQEQLNPLEALRRIPG